MKKFLVIVALLGSFSLHSADPFQDQLDAAIAASLDDDLQRAIQLSLQPNLPGPAPAPTPHTAPVPVPHDHGHAVARAHSPVDHGVPAPPPLEMKKMKKWLKRINAGVLTLSQVLTTLEYPSHQQQFQAYFDNPLLASVTDTIAEVDCEICYANRTSWSPCKTCEYFVCPECFPHLEACPSCRKTEDWHKPLPAGFSEQSAEDPALIAISELEDKIQNERIFMIERAIGQTTDEIREMERLNPMFYHRDIDLSRANIRREQKRLLLWENVMNTLSLYRQTKKGNVEVIQGLLNLLSRKHHQPITEAQRAEGRAISSIAQRIAADEDRAQRFIRHVRAILYYKVDHPSDIPPNLHDYH